MMENAVASSAGVPPLLSCAASAMGCRPAGQQVVWRLRAIGVPTGSNNRCSSNPEFASRGPEIARGARFGAGRSRRSCAPRPRPQGTGKTRPEHRPAGQKDARSELARYLRPPARRYHPEGNQNGLHWSEMQCRPASGGPGGTVNGWPVATSHARRPWNSSVNRRRPSGLKRTLRTACSWSRLRE